MLIKLDMQYLPNNQEVEPVLRHNTRQIVCNDCVMQLKATSKKAVQQMLDGLFVLWLVSAQIGRSGYYKA